MKLLLVCGVRNWSLMFFVLFVKKVAKSSAVRVDEGGGQRREEKVLKSAQESEQLLILLWQYVILAVETFAEKEERCD